MYSASKGAVELLSETMTLEMKPLGVNVVTVMTGSIKTQWFINVPKLVLPEDSYYTSVEENVAAYARGDLGVPETEVDVYAGRVVRDVLGGAQGTIWRGAQSTIIRLLLPCLPGWLAVSIKAASPQETALWLTTYIQRMLLAKGAGLHTLRL